ncbi:MAG: cytochrome P450 [Elainellaceae cyanobacterium]
MTTNYVETPHISPLEHREIDGPKAKGLRRFLRVFRLILQPTEYMDDNVRRYGPMFKIGGERPLVYVGDPDVVREIFMLDATTAATGQGNGVLKTMVGEHSILLLDDDAHQRQRKLLMPPFHGDRLRAYAQLICDQTRRVSADWQPGQSIVARRPMQELTLGVILRAVFGLGEGERLAQVQQSMGAMLDSFSSPLSSVFLFFPVLQKDWGAWSPWGQFIQRREHIRALLYAEIRDRRQYLAQHLNKTGPGEKNDILTLLLQAKDEQGEGMSDEELHDELVTLLLAGHETTASALVWMLYWIHYLPEVQQKLRAELATLGPDLDPMAIAKLPYLTAVCQEALRIYPITPTTFVRTLRQPMTLAGYAFTAGTTLMPATYIIHQNPDIYPEPRQFRPERFLERQYAPHEYLPFGGGHRRCIGSALAMMELKLSIATLLQDFEFILPHPRKLLPTRRGLTLAPPASLKIKVQ